MTQCRCTLYRVRGGWAPLLLLGRRQVGQPAVYDLDTGDGGRSSVRDVIAAMKRADRGVWGIGDYRLRVQDAETGEVLDDDYAATDADTALELFTDDELRAEMWRRRELRGAS